MRRLVPISVMAVLLAGTLIGPAVAELASVSASAASSGRSWLPATPAGWPLVVDQSRTRRVPISHGVTGYSETYDAVGGRQHTQVLDVNLADHNIRAGVVEAGDRLTDPADETLSSMAGRTGAIAGINGDYFEINATGRPLGGVISGGRLLKSPLPNYNAQLGVRPDGSMVIGPQSYTGTVDDGAQSHAITSVNTVNDLSGGGITRITPDLGGPTAFPAASTLVLGHSVSGGFVVDSVATGVSSVPGLGTGQEGLAGGGAGGSWLASTVHQGDTLKISETSPHLTALMDGATQLVKDGQAYNDPTGRPPGGANPGRNPETAVGLSRDGEHAILVAIDGRTGESVASGVTPAEATGYLLAHGAYSGILFDGGGSTELVSRQLGDTRVSVANTPSDGHERPVANGLFLYSTAASAGPATKVVINGGTPVTTVPGATVDVPVYATDSSQNPAAGSTQVQVVPGSLGSWSGGKLTVRRPGSGVLVARNGRATAVEPLRVVSRLGSLSMSPSQADVINGGTQSFTLSSGEVAIPASAAQWSVSPAGVGVVNGGGLFTAAASGAGLATVTATVGGASASASVAVGSESTVINDLADASGWNLRNTTGQPASLSSAAGVVPPGSKAAGSLQLGYTVPGGPGVKQLVLSPKAPLSAGAGPSGQDPTGIGLWIKGDGSGINLAESYIGADGVTTTLYPTTVTWKDWRLVVAPLPAGLKFPLSISFIDFLGINSATTLTGVLNVAGLQALYSPRPVVAPPYVAIPKNPSWLSYSEDSGRFGPGTTLLTGDDAHLLASDPGSASSNVMSAIAGRLPSLVRPDRAQFLGDMSDDGVPADLQYARSKMASLGLPFKDAVGNHEISQGALPETGGFASVFGDTHYSYGMGAATVVVTDNAHGGLLSSDSSQVPSEPQYPWLVKQLSAARTPAVLVVTHMPAYDPHPVADSQFGDRWEARMYVRLIQRYQETHPGKHVVMLYGHARGFSEQILDPSGAVTDTAHGGIPQLVFADLGMPAYATPDKGGFAHFGLVHVSSAGRIQFSVEPVLASVTVTVPAVAVGHSVQAVGTGTTVGGDNLAGVVMPIADPASHVWSSSNPSVATVDKVTGTVTARRSGSATISVTSGGVTGSTAVTVP